MQHVKNATSTLVSSDTLSQVRPALPSFSWVSPAENEVFEVTEQASFPAIDCTVATDGPGPFLWTWAITWQARTGDTQGSRREELVLRTFTAAGSLTTDQPSWTVDLDGQVLGGQLTVTVSRADKTLKRTLTIRGREPDSAVVAQTIAGLEDAPGFDQFLAQESHTRHFIERDGEPIVAFDHGYGIAQLTDPAPTYEQAWNWKANLAVGLSLYREKARQARQRLEQQTGSCTDEQLLQEVSACWKTPRMTKKEVVAPVVIEPAQADLRMYHADYVCHGSTSRNIDPVGGRS